MARRREEKKGDGEPIPRDYLSDFLEGFQSAERIRAKEQLKRQRRRLTKNMVGIVAYAMIASAVVIFVLQGISRPFKVVESTQDLALISRIQQLESSLEAIEDRVNALDRLVSDEELQNVAVASLAIEVGSLIERQGIIERSVTLNPDEALTTTLIKDGQSRLEADVNSLASALDELRGFFIALLIGGLVAPLVSYYVGVGRGRAK